MQVCSYILHITVRFLFSITLANVMLRKTEIYDDNARYNLLGAQSNTFLTVRRICYPYVCRIFNLSLYFQNVIVFHRATKFLQRAATVPRYLSAIILWNEQFSTSVKFFYLVNLSKLEKQE